MVLAQPCLGGAIDVFQRMRVGENVRCRPRHLETWPSLAGTVVVDVMEAIQTTRLQLSPAR